MNKHNPNRGPRLDSVGRGPRRNLNQPSRMDSFSSPRRRISPARQQSSARPKNPTQQQRKNGPNKRQFDESIKAIGKEPRKKRSFFSRTKRNPRFKRNVKLFFQANFLLVFAVGGFLAFKLFSAAQSVVVDRGDSALGLQENIDPSQLKGEGDGRVNILLMGIPGDKNHDGNQLSDVNMVVSIDPVNNTAAMLSLPRDMYVDVPGYYQTRINAAHAIAEQDKAGTGPKVAKETVESVLDIDIHYFVRVDFQGFVDIIDRIGGVTVDVEQPIIDRTIESRYGGTHEETFRIDAGQQHLDGRVALQYVRTRKGINSGNDFGRARRQQQILKAVKDKVLTLGTFSNPVKLSGIIDAIGNHVRTDLSLSDMMRLLEIADSIDTSSVRNVVLSNAPDSYLASYNAGGAAVLVPKAGIGDYSEIRKFVKGDLFADGFLRKENAEVTVLNGTTEAGLASEVAETLEGVGYGIGDITNAPTSDVTQTVIYDQTGGAAPFTRRLLEQRFGVTVKDGLPATISSTSDFVIVLGTDYEEN